jgi:hypothetical protein
MKGIFFFVLFSFFSIADYGQSVADSMNLKSFLFENFMEGVVRMKSGIVAQASLNYNTDNQAVVFIKNGQYMVFADEEAVDTIYLQQKKFLAIDKAFYEMVYKASPVTLLVTYTNKVHPFKATTDHNGTSKQSNSQVSNTVSDVYVNRTFKGYYSIEILKQYWFLKNDMLYKVNPKKQFLDSFPSKVRKAIDSYIVTNNINIMSEADLIKLVDFCNTMIN